MNAARLTVWLRRRIARVPMLALWLIAVGVVALVSRGGLVSAALARGFAENIELSVGPIDSGRIAFVMVKLGQPVKQGEVVARLDTTLLDADLARAGLEVEAKKAQVASQRESLESEVARAGIWVLRARAGEQEDRSQITELQRRVERLQKLVGEQLASRSELEEAQRLLVALSARVTTYDQVLKKSSEDGRTVLSGSTHSVAESIAIRLEPALRSVALAEADVKRLELRREAAVLRAPQDGTISLIAHRAGEVIGAGSEVVRVMAPCHGRVLAYVVGPRIEDPQVGQVVRVERPGLFRKWWSGTIVELGSDVEQIPQRLWLAPHVPVFGRRVIVQLEPAELLLAGEAFDVRY